MLMIVRRGDGKRGSELRRYTLHYSAPRLYHPRTARLYTDFGLLTCNGERIGITT